MKDILLDYKKYIVGSKESTQIESASNIDFKKEAAKFAYFDIESFDIYQETLYNNVEDYLFYIGIAHSSDLLGEQKFHLGNKPSDIFKVIENNGGGDFKAGIKRTGREYVEYFIATKDNKYDTIQIIGVDSPSMFDKLTESLTEDHVKKTLIESNEDLDMSFIYKTYSDSSEHDVLEKLRVPLNLFDLVVGNITELGIELEEFGKDLFFGALADARITLQDLGLKYTPKMQPAGGFVVGYSDHNKYRRLLDKIIGKYIKEYNLKSSTVSESIKLRIGE